MATAGAAIASAVVAADAMFPAAVADMPVDGPEALMDVLPVDRVVLEAGREYVPEVEAGPVAGHALEAEHVLEAERVLVVERVPVVAVADREAVVTTKTSGR
jgi:hypothetical protein